MKVILSNYEKLEEEIKKTRLLKTLSVLLPAAGVEPAHVAWLPVLVSVCQFATPANSNWGSWIRTTHGGSPGRAHQQAMPQ